MFQVRELSEYIQHSKFALPKYFDDICFLHFDEPFVQNGDVQPVLLASKTPYTGADCFISGWGSTSVSLL